MKYLFLGGPADGLILQDIEGNKIKFPTCGGLVVYVKNDNIILDGVGLFLPKSWDYYEAMEYLLENYNYLAYGKAD